MRDSIASIDKAIMQLTGYGANNTSYLLDVKKELIRYQEALEFIEFNTQAAYEDSMDIIREIAVEALKGENE